MEGSELSGGGVGGGAGVGGVLRWEINIRFGSHMGP